MFGDYNTSLEEVASSPFNTSYAQHLENEEDSADSDEEIQTEKEDASETGNEKRKSL